MRGDPFASRPAAELTDAAIVLRGRQTETDQNAQVEPCESISSGRRSGTAGDPKFHEMVHFNRPGKQQLPPTEPALPRRVPFPSPERRVSSPNILGPTSVDAATSAKTNKQESLNREVYVIE